MKNQLVKYWKISAGKESIFWKDFVNNNFAAFGEWDEGNLDQYKDQKKKLVERLKKYSIKTWPKKYSQGSTSGYQLWNFYDSLKPGDILILYGKLSIFAIGEVTGRYWYEEAPNDECGYPHRVPVKWAVPEYPITNLSKNLIKKLSKPTDTFHEIKSLENIVQLKKIYENIADPSRVKDVPNDWDKAECYFAVWGYDQIDIGDYTTKQEIIRDISELIGRTEKSVEYKLQNVSHFDQRPREQKPFAEKRNAQKLLGQVFKWYWSDREKARKSYSDFEQLLQIRDKSDFQGDISDVKKSTSTLFVEEGQLTKSQQGQRKRSRKLLEEGRKHFK